MTNNASATTIPATAATASAVVRPPRLSWEGGAEISAVRHPGRLGWRQRWQCGRRLTLVPFSIHHLEPLGLVRLLYLLRLFCFPCGVVLRGLLPGAPSTMGGRLGRPSQRELGVTASYAAFKDQPSATLPVRRAGGSQRGVRSSPLLRICKGS